MKAKRSIRRILLGLSFSLLIVPAFTIKSSAGLLATDSVSANHYNAVASGYLAVYDNYAYATTSYARSGSDIGVGASIDATYRYGGKNNVLNDVDTSSGGGATARVDISVNRTAHSSIFACKRCTSGFCVTITFRILDGYYGMDQIVN